MADRAMEPSSVVVCGGGVIGACTAYYLATMGARVTLVEKNSVASGASGQAPGFLTSRYGKDSLFSVLATAGFRLHEELASSLGGSHNYGYERVPALRIFLELPSDEEHSTSPTGSPYHPPWVDSPAFRRPETLGNEDDTALVHPERFIQTIVAAAVNIGVDLVHGKVLKVKVKGGLATGVSVFDKQLGMRRLILADAVVLALGAWSQGFQQISSLFSFSTLYSPSMFFQMKNTDCISPCGLQVMFHSSTGEDVPSHYEELCFETFPMYATSKGEIYICGMSRHAGMPGNNPEKIVVDPKSFETLNMAVGMMSSQLRRGVSGVVKQACFVLSSVDGMPLIGEVPGIENCYIGTGHGQWGILNGPATGKSLAQLILKEESEVDITPFSPSRISVRRFKREYNRLFYGK